MMNRGIFFAGLGLLVLGAGGRAQQQPPLPRPAPTPPHRRGFFLPEDHSIGRFYVRANGAEADAEWDHLVEARGRVLVPPNHEAKLEFHRTAAADVKLLMDFKPGSLAGLSLKGLSIQDADLASLRHLTALRELDLSGTPVTDEALQHLEPLKNLEVLRLSATRISDAGLSAVARLEKLLILDLPAPITPAGLVRLSERSTLRVLSLRGNTNLEGADALRGLVPLQALQKLDLAESNLSDAAGRELCQMKRLEDLDVSRTAVGDETVRALSQSRILTHLNLTRTKVSDTGVISLASASSLETLLLGWTSVTDAALESVGKLRLLKRLSLAGAPVTDQGVRRLMPLAGTLQDLTLLDARISDGCCGDLETFTALKRLVVRGTGLSEGCRERLSQALPKCAIVN